MKILLFISIWILAVQVWWEQKNLVIHVAPHSHNDAGWLMPFEDYYKKFTKNILDRVVNYLAQHPDK